MAIAISDVNDRRGLSFFWAATASKFGLGLKVLLHRLVIVEVVRKVDLKTAASNSMARTRY